MSVIRSASISAQRAAASAPEPSETRNSVSQSAFLRRVKGVESNHRVQSTTFKLGPDEVMHVECPCGSSHYLLLSNDDIDEQDHGIIHASADRMIVHVHNLATVEREFTIIWA